MALYITVVLSTLLSQHLKVRSILDVPVLGARCINKVMLPSRADRTARRLRHQLNFFFYVPAQYYPRSGNPTLNTSSLLFS